MSDQAVVRGSENETEDGEAVLPPAKKWSGKRIVFFIVLPFLVVVAGGGAGVYFSGILGGKEPAAEDVKKEAEAQHTAIFFDIPDLLVNLNTSGKRTSFLKLKV